MYDVTLEKTNKSIEAHVMEISCERAETKEVGHRLMATKRQAMVDLDDKRDIYIVNREVSHLTMVEASIQVCDMVEVARVARRRRHR
jgi:hypothetical protein